MLWLILGILIGLGLFGLYTKVKAGQLIVRWYQWVLGIMAVIMLLLTIENYLGFQEELEPVAANFVILAMGLPAVILAVIAYFIPKFSVKFKSADKQHKATS